LPYFQNALDLRRELLATYLTSPDLAGMTENERRERYSVSLASDLSRSLLGVGDARYRLGDKETGLHLVDAAVGLREKLLTENPRSRQLKWELARTYRVTHGDSYDRDVATARKHLEGARELMQDLVDQDPNNVRYRRDVGSVYDQLGRLERRAKDESAAQQYFTQCRAIREALATIDPSNSNYQMDLMLVLAQCGEHERAAAIAEKVGGGQSPDNEILADVAKCLAQCAAAAASDSERKRHYEQKAIDALKVAVKQGFRGDFDARLLDPIREHPDYVALRKSLEQETAAAPKKTPPPAQEP